MCKPEKRVIQNRCVICVALAILLLLTAVSGCTQKVSPTPAQTSEPTKTPDVTPTEPAVVVPSEPGGVVIPSAPVEVVRVTGLSISDEVLNLHIGESATVNITIEPKDATRKIVTWSSGNSLVAELSEETNTSAKITGKSEGTVLITAVSEDGGKLAACIVTVTKAEPEGPTTRITIEPSNPVVSLGATLKLTANVYPSNGTTKNLTWSSSALGVALVSQDGVVTAVGLGTAVITARTPDGKTATCTVEVKELSVPVTGVTLSMDSAILRVGDYLLLTATVSPENATNRYVNWASSNSTVATVSASGEIRAVGVGTATITASSSDGNITARCEIEVVEKEVTIEGIELNTKSQYLKVGGSAKLTAIVYPEGVKVPTLVWTTSDDSIVTVSQGGELNAKSVGVATVTVSTEDGTYSASCAVIVSR